MDNNADKIKILIIEDDPDIREGVRILLESEGFAVIEAEDGRDGYDAGNVGHQGMRGDS